GALEEAPVLELDRDADADETPFRERVFRQRVERVLHGGVAANEAKEQECPGGVVTKALHGFCLLLRGKGRCGSIEHSAFLSGSREIIQECMRSQEGTTMFRTDGVENQNKIFWSSTSAPRDVGSP